MSITNHTLKSIGSNLFWLGGEAILIGNHKATYRSNLAYIVDLSCIDLIKDGDEQFTEPSGKLNGRSRSN
jgi:hypothetical protein